MLAKMTPQTFGRFRSPFLSNKSMKTVIILVYIVIAIGFWFLNPDVFDSGSAPTSEQEKAAVSVGTTDSAPSPELPGLPLPRDVAPKPQEINEPKVTHQVVNAMEQAVKSIAAKNEILLQLSDKGELVGKRLDTITKIIGAPTSVDHGRVIYRLDNGFGGFEWAFECPDGVIFSVIKNDLD